MFSQHLNKESYLKKEMLIHTRTVVESYMFSILTDMETMAL